MSDTQVPADPQVPCALSELSFNMLQAVGAPSTTQVSARARLQLVQTLRANCDAIRARVEAVSAETHMAAWAIVWKRVCLGYLAAVLVYERLASLIGPTAQYPTLHAHAHTTGVLAIDKSFLLKSSPASTLRNACGCLAILAAFDKDPLRWMVTSPAGAVPAALLLLTDSTLGSLQLRLQQQPQIPAVTEALGHIAKTLNFYSKNQLPSLDVYSGSPQEYNAYTTFNTPLRRLSDVPNGTDRADLSQAFAHWFINTATVNFYNQLGLRAILVMENSRLDNFSQFPRIAEQLAKQLDHRVIDSCTASDFKRKGFNTPQPPLGVLTYLWKLYSPAPLARCGVCKLELGSGGDATNLTGGIDIAVSGHAFCEACVAKSSVLGLTPPAIPSTAQAQPGEDWLQPTTVTAAPASTGLFDIAIFTITRMDRPLMWKPRPFMCDPVPSNAARSNKHGKRPKRY